MQHPDLNLFGARDQLFAKTPYPRSFAFDAEVAGVFDDMISRSVPLYREVIALICQWSRDFPPPAGSLIYDIGCSTGTSLYALAQQLAPAGHFVGIDMAQPMLDRAGGKLRELATRHRIDLYCGNALDFRFTDAHMVLLNYTLQFIAVTDRGSLLRTIYEDLQPGGMLFISEKIVARCSEIHGIYTRHYEAFKRRAGYSTSEIERKKAALDQVLIPLSLDEQIALLQQAGFRRIDVLCKWQNFVTLVAIK
jgi:tRNA (cmo5U34)-methyltransferase